MNQHLEPVAQERRILTEIPGPKSQRIHQHRQEVIPTGVATTLPIYIDRAKDSIVVDVDGNHFIDFGCGIGVTTVGHANDAVVEAAMSQLNKVTHTLFTVTPYEQYVSVAELLAQHTPGNHQKKTVLVNSGAEAVENGVKIARKYTARRAVAVLEHSYHGRTNLTMAMNYKAMPYATGFGPFAGDVYHAPNSYPFHDGLNGQEACTRTTAYLEKVVGSEDLACLVVEPIQGEGGFIVPADGYLEGLQRWCTEHGVVFIADEVQSGMARTGRYFASEHWNVVPDIVLSAKGIAGGLPLAAVTGRAEIMDASQPGGLGGTFGGNPVSAAASVAVFETIERHNLLQNAQRIETILFERLLAMQKKYNIIGEVRGKGAMIALEFIEPQTAAKRPVPYAAPVKHITDYAAQRGVLFLSAGTWGNVLRFLPPLVITDALLHEAMDILEEAIGAF